MSTIPAASSEITIKHLYRLGVYFWKLIWRKWILLCIVGLTGGILGIILAWIEKPKYEAVVSFSAEADEGSSLGGIAGIAAQFGVTLGGGGGIFTGDNILALIKSRKMVSETLLLPMPHEKSNKNFLNYYIDATGFSKRFKSGPMKGVSFPQSQSPSTYTRLQDSVFMLITDDLIKKHIIADRPDKKLQLFVLNCTTNDELFSQQFVLSLLNHVSDYYTETRTAKAKQTLDFIQKRADSVKNAYDIALTGKATLLDANLNPAFQTPQVNVQRKQTDITVLAGAYAEILKNLEIARFTLQRETPLVQIVDSPVLPLRLIKTGRALGGIIGGILAGLLCVIFIVAKDTLRQLRASEKAA
jgi:hypothetical protein